MRYIILRFLESLLTVFIIITLVFLLMRLLPADKYFSEEELRVLTNDQIQTILEANGLLDSPLKQLVRYYKQLFVDHDFGVSRRIKVDVPVWDLIGDRFANSVRFGVISTIVALVLGVVFGIIQAKYKDGIIDQIGLLYTIVANAVPGLVYYTLIMVAGSTIFGLPPLYTTKQPVLSSILPIICLSIGGIAGRMLWVRRYMVDEMNKDYIKLATARGLSNNQILVRHVFRNAFVPFSSGIPAAFLHTISGSMIVETFFSIPGMGYLLTEAIGTYDYNVVQTLVMLYGFLGVMGTFLGDLTLTIVDPRVRLGKKDETR